MLNVWNHKLAGTPMPTTREALLTAALRAIPFEGWNAAMLENAARQAGFSVEEAASAFPGGVTELAEAFVATLDAGMHQRVAAMDLPSLKVRERVAACVRARLEAAAPHREAARRLLAWLALPQNVPLGIKLLARTADEIWHLCGDTATDWNWYSKRLLLAGVYSSTLVYWLNDNSENYHDTWDFLTRRIEDVMKIQKLKGKLAAAVKTPLRPRPNLRMKP